MRDLERNQQSIYYCKRNLSEGGIEYFDAPVEIKCSALPVSNEWLDSGKGIVEMGIRKFTLFYTDKDFAHGDRWYIDVPPVESDVTAQKADYITIGIEHMVNSVAVVLKRTAV